MMKSFSTGLTGLKSNQMFLEIIGNNLANVNTIGYRADRVSFNDIYSQTIRPGSAPGAGLGGLNPLQVGSGTSIGSIAKIFSQGNLQNTGRTFDLGISGEGFFRLSDGLNSYYSRAGAFGLDANENLIDLATGLNVQSVSGSNINIDSDTVAPGQATSLMEMAGNLPGKVTGPTAEVLESGAAFVTGTQASLVGAQAAVVGGTGQITMTVDETTFTVDFDGTEADSDALVTKINDAATAAGITSAVAAQTTDIITLTSPGSGTSSTVSIADVTGTMSTDLGFTSGDSATGTEDPADEDTNLNDLLNNIAAYADGDIINITGVDSDGTEIAAQFTYATGSAETLGHLRDAITAAFPGATATIDGTGNLVVTSDTLGESELSVTLADDPDDTFAGEADWASSAFAVTSEGLGPDTVTTSLEVFDENGQAHAVTMNFERQDGDVWSLTATIPEDEGTVVSGTISDITFNDDGTFASVAGDGNLEFQFNGITGSQTVAVAFGTPGTFDGLTQFGDTSTAFIKSQDGFPPGELTSIFIDPDGTIQGAFSNGRIDEIDQIGISMFTNPGGLVRSGDNLFSLGSNSGDPNFGEPGEAGRGIIRSGVLEVSNVDTSQEFINLIIAQRGFQVNSRVVTTTDTILQELIGIVR